MSTHKLWILAQCVEVHSEYVQGVHSSSVSEGT